MKYFFYFSILLTVAVLVGCTKEIDYRISHSIFIEDRENPGLPIYSEKGYNSYGVYWDLLPLTTQYPNEPSKIIVFQDTTYLNLTGSDGTTSHTLSFSIPEYLPDSYTELISLNNKNFNLSQSDCSVSLLYGAEKSKLQIFEGNLTINRAQNLYVDKILNGVVLSGVFSFKALLNSRPVTFSNGRFDMRFGDENFYNLQEYQ